ncbi:hypothetical protein N0V90_007926 [Kalmusia sp. IMI 367209]|nr:hypothetical protein N0V90_007926 [Kalmusia sp. IMI 367209]
MDNGMTPYDGGAKKVYGRFNILCVSRAVNEEAAWVLFTQGSLVIESTPALEPYLSEKECTYYRLPNLPAKEYAKHMWMTAARFRNVCFELPRLYFQDPVEYTNRLCEAVAFLLKAWELKLDKSTSSPSQIVEVHLKSLYTSIIPFNTNISLQWASTWTSIHQPHIQSGHVADFELIGDRTARIVERLIDILGRHGGLSQWKVVVEAPPSFNEDTSEKAPFEGFSQYVSENTIQDEQGSLCRLHELKKRCQSNGVKFATKPIR